MYFHYFNIPISYLWGILVNFGISLFYILKYHIFVYSMVYSIVEVISLEFFHFLGTLSSIILVIILMWVFHYSYNSIL
jgi:hypothetical protein